jgi:hypothetical protein
MISEKGVGSLVCSCSTTCSCNSNNN